MVKESYILGYREALEKLGFDWAKGFGNILQGPGANISKSIGEAAGNTIGRNASVGMAAAGGSIQKATGASTQVGKGLSTTGKVGG